MKILILTARYPIPPIGGDKLRIYHIARFLSAHGHRLTLMSLTDENDIPSGVRDASTDGIFERVVTLRLPTRRRYMNSASGIFSPLPLQVSYFQSREFQKAVDAELNAGGYDAVLCHFVRTAELVRRRSDVRRVCEMTDAFSMYYHEVIRLGKGGFRNLLYRGLEFRRMRRYERDILATFDRSVVVSRTDKEYIVSGRHDLSEKLDVVPNGVDCEALRFHGGPYDDRMIVFIGNMRTSRNCDACEYFADEILPGIRRDVGDVRFKIIGTSPRRGIRRLARRPGIIVTGQVDDVQQEARDAAVSVCPLRLAVGVQNKVLEAMAMGIPVVSTPMGVKGLEVKWGRELLVGRGPDEFARHVASVLRSENLRRELAASARKRVEEGYSWEQRLARYDEIFRELT